MPYTDWEECNEADYIVKKCADFAVGGQLGNWSLNVPSKAGEYVIYAVPVDIYGTAPQTPYEGIYKSSFSVASELCHKRILQGLRTDSYRTGRKPNHNLYCHIR